MNAKQILPWIVVAVLGVGGYFFKDKLFGKGGAVPSSPVSDLPAMKSTIRIDKVEGGKVEFTVSLEAKQDIEVYGLRAFYYDKTKRREYSGVGNSKRTTLDSDEIGDLDMLDGKLAMKAGEKKEITAYFELTKIISSHYIEISGKLDSPCPPDMDVIPCMEKQKAEAEKDPKSREIYMLQRILENKEK